MPGIVTNCRQVASGPARVPALFVTTASSSRICARSRRIGSTASGSVALREPGRARVSRDATGLQCTGWNHPVRSSCAMPSASRRSVLTGGRPPGRQPRCCRAGHACARRAIRDPKAPSLRSRSCHRRRARKQTCLPPTRPVRQGFPLSLSFPLHFDQDALPRDRLRHSRWHMLCVAGTTTPDRQPTHVPIRTGVGANRRPVTASRSP